MFAEKLLDEFHLRLKTNNIHFNTFFPIKSIRLYIVDIDPYFAHLSKSSLLINKIKRNINFQNNYLHDNFTINGPSNQDERK